MTDFAITVAWYQVMALAARGELASAESLAGVLRARTGNAPRFRYLEDVARIGIDPAAGRARTYLARLELTIAELEREDPHGRLPYVLAMGVLVLRDIGERERGA